MIFPGTSWSERRIRTYWSPRSYSELQRIFLIQEGFVCFFVYKMYEHFVSPTRLIISFHLNKFTLKVCRDHYDFRIFYAYILSIGNKFKDHLVLVSPGVDRWEGPFRSSRSHWTTWSGRSDRRTWTNGREGRTCNYIWFVFLLLSSFFTLTLFYTYICTKSKSISMERKPRRKYLLGSVVS